MLYTQTCTLNLPDNGSGMDIATVITDKAGAILVVLHSIISSFPSLSDLCHAVYTQHHSCSARNDCEFDNGS